MIHQCDTFEICILVSDSDSLCYVQMVCVPLFVFCDVLTFYFIMSSDCRYLMVWAGMSSPGSPLILLDVHSTSGLQRPGRYCWQFYFFECRRVRSSDQSSSSFSFLTCCSWWSVMDFIHTAMQTTLRSMGFATRRMLTHCKSICRSALTEGFSWMMSDWLQLQDWGALVFICLMLASDPDWSCSGWWQICAAGTNSSRPGVYIDADITMSVHIIAVVKACFAALRQICSVCHSLTRTTLLTLVHALVVTKADYCSSVLSGISGQLLHGCCLCSVAPLVSCSPQGSRST